MVRQMIKKYTFGIGVTTLLLLSFSVRSQAIYFGPHLGIQKAQDAEKSNYLVGATLRMKLLPGIGAEGDIGYRQEKFGSGAVTVKNWPVTVTGLLYPLPIVYGGLGGGWYNTTFDYADSYNQMGFADEAVKKFGWHLAAGVELPASPKLKVFGDVRYVFLDYKFKELPGGVLDGAKANFYSLNFGLLLRL